MAESESKGDIDTGDLDRRRLLAAGAVTAATAALAGTAMAQRPVEAVKPAAPAVEKASSVAPSGTFETRAAIPQYKDYYDQFAKKHFAHDKILNTLKRLKKRNFSATNLVWGNYQKFSPNDPKDTTEWGTGGDKRYNLWESAVAHAREDLAKIPAPSGDGPDPDNPSDKKTSLLEHLDAAVKIALFKKMMPGATEPGFPIEVKIGFTTKLLDRRHAVKTTWQQDPSVPANCKLIIEMTCPISGWLGTALGTGYDPISNGVVKSFRATYTVPKQPADKDDQILFIFNGVESLPGSGVTPGILQPVLQWTKAGTWAVRSWYVPVTHYASFATMPANGDAKAFSDANTIAYTAAQSVEVGDVLTGEITLSNEDTGTYSSKFFLNGDEANPIAKLDVTGIGPMTYPVAVIEGYRPKKNESDDFPPPLTPKHLVDIQMDDVALVGNLSGEMLPDWNLGREKDLGNGIEKGTNKLKAYKVTAIYDADANTSTLKFKRKKA